MNKTTAANRAYRPLVSAKDLSLASERFREGKLPNVFVHFRLSRDWTKMQILDSKGFISDNMRPGKTWLQLFIHPDDQPQVKKVINRAIRTKHVFMLEHRIRRPDGSLAWLLSRAVPVLDEDGKIAEWRGATNDATESVEAVDTLAAEEAKYRAVVETSGDGFLMVNREGRICSVNDAYVRRSGYSRKELLSMSVADLEAVESSADVQAHVKKIITEGSDLFETQHRTKDGVRWPVEVGVSYVQADGGLFVSFARDLTERKALEQMIVEAASSEQERIAHELHDGVGQQLTALSMLASGLARRLRAAGSTADADAAEDIMKHIQTALTDVRDIVRGLAPVELYTGNLNEALSELTNWMAKSAGIDFRYHATRNVVVEQQSTATHLYRIAQEAIQNAIKHSNPKRIDVRLEHKGGHLVLTVSDDGNGIEQDHERRKGLGLHIMKNRCSSIGGQLSIQPRKSGGTIVCCKLLLSR
jgi:two-component system, chemotaxis family, CheB/CheR fusion protein